MSSFLEKLAHPFSVLFKSEGGSVIGLDFGASAIKVVQARKKAGRAVLETYGELYLGPYGDLEIGRATNLLPETIGKALEDLFREAGVTSRRASVGVPLRSTLVTHVTLPMHDERNLPAMIALEARKYIPLSPNEITLDWILIPQPKDELGTKDVPKAEVVLVAIQNSILRTLGSILKTAKIQTDSYEVEIFSAARSVVGDELEPVVVVDIGAGLTKISIVDYGIPRLSHTIMRGSQDLSLALSRARNISFDAAESSKRDEGITAISEIAYSPVLDFIFFEAGQLLSTYEKKVNRTIKKGVFIGGGALLTGLLPRVEKRFKVPVELGNPFARLEAPAFLAPVLAQAGPEFAVAVGLVLKELSQIEN
ncbi:MAG: pilus assembly protein PilM [Patescibacteria group bacterium]